ncbi:MAG: N-6 DNA methylase [Vampirovibrionales bacterium]|nr:N-6 DNA methylase [Vampirovibrionales bacterium]
MPLLRSLNAPASASSELPFALNEPLSGALALLSPGLNPARARQRLIWAFLALMTDPIDPLRQRQRLFPLTEDETPLAPEPDRLWEQLRWICQLFALGPAHLGALYERLLHLDASGRRKGGGCFYTPDALARAMADFVMTALARQNRRLSTGLALLDPAMGGGAFLRACADVWLSDSAAPNAAIWKSLHGADLDAGALEAARLSLWAQAGCPSATPPLRFMGEQLQVADALLEPIARQFDGIIGNPPYLGVKQALDAGKRAAYEAAFQTARGQYDLYGLFIERSLALLKPGGILAFLLPKPLLVNEHQQAVRRLLLENRLLAAWDIGKDAFSPQAAVETVALFVERAGLTPQNPEKPFIACRWDRRAAEAKPAAEIFQSDMNRFEERALNLWLTPPRVCFLDAMAAHSCPLASLLAEDGARHQGRGIEAGKNRCAKSRRSEADRPVLSGQDVSAFQLPLTPRHFIRPDALDAKTLKPMALYQTPRLLIRRVADTPIAALDESVGWLTLNTLYNFHLRDNALLPAICALINSPPARAWFRLRYYFSEALFPYLRQQQILAIPIPSADRLTLAMPDRDNDSKPSRGNVLQELTFIYRQFCEQRPDSGARALLHERLLAVSCLAYGVQASPDWLETA